MRRVLFFGIPLILAIIVFVGVVYFLGKNGGKGAIQVTANPKSNVYLNGQLIGQTPICKCEIKDMLSVGEYTIRIAPVEDGYSAFEQKIPVNKSVLTVVDRTFGKGVDSEGSIITLSPIDEKKVVQLLVLSSPDKTTVSLDNSESGNTPLLLKNVTESDHEVRFNKDGYREKIVRIKTVAGYKLTATVFLAINPQVLAPVVPTASPSAAPVVKVTILETPTGFLRVRTDPSVSAAEVTRVLPGALFELVSEQPDWYQIKLADGKLGWISSQYGKK